MNKKPDWMKDELTEEELAMLKLRDIFRKATNTGHARVTPIIQDDEEDWPLPNHRTAGNA